MASRLRAWLRRRMRSSGKTLPRKTTIGGPNKQPSSNIRKDAPPPPYNTLDLVTKNIHQPPRSIDGSESIEVLRARNPATRPPREDSHILRPPRHKTRPIAAIEAAAAAAVIGTARALDESDPKMVAARTAQAIAVAVSTSRSYADFVAAVTAAESCALLLVEETRDKTPPDRCREHTKNAIYAAADTAMAADAGITPKGAWPFNIYDTHSSESSSGKVPTFETCSYTPPAK